ncbi:MAG: M28 family peptidase [Cytophagales bacterium]
MKKLLFPILTILIFQSCKKSKNTDTTTENNTSSNAVELAYAPEANADSAFKFVQKQVDFGKRIPNTIPHKNCAKYFVETFKKYNWEVIEQKFEAPAYDKTILKLTNIVASYNPKATKRILLAAHWDTRPFADQDPDQKNHKKPIDGANDGGSGVGVLLELARAINECKTKPGIGIDIVLFDGEDYGTPSFAEHEEGSSKTWCLGSQYWSKNTHTPNYQAYYGILLDMVGAKDAKFAKDGTSRMFATDVQEMIWNVAASMKLENTFTNMYSDEIIDDHLFVNKDAKIPMVDIIEYEPSDGAYFSKTWHTLEDNIDNIDKNSLKKVGDLLLQLVYREK